MNTPPIPTTRFSPTNFLVSYLHSSSAMVRDASLRLSTCMTCGLQFCVESSAYVAVYVVGKLISSMPDGTGWPCMRPLGTGLSKWTVRQGSLAKTDKGHYPETGDYMTFIYMYLRWLRDSFARRVWRARLAQGHIPRHSPMQLDGRSWPQEGRGYVAMRVRLLNELLLCSQTAVFWRN